MINARVDLWLHGDAHAVAAPIDEALRRARAYLAAGADCIYPIGLSDLDVLTTFVEELGAPVNVAAGPTMPSLQELAQIGVARVSTATRLATLAFAAVDHAAGLIRESGRFGVLDSPFTYADAQDLFARAD